MSIEIFKIRRLPDNDTALETYEGLWAAAAMHKYKGMIVSDTHFDKYEDAERDRQATKNELKNFLTVKIFKTGQKIRSRDVSFTTVIPVQ